jgi:beta-phosphoglucomutase-like phosphatase (HAD superfamily)
MRALLFDFNGTLSHDEPLLCELFCTLFAEAGRPLSEQEYYERLAGLSDLEIVRTWLGRDDPELQEELLRRYLVRAGDGSTVPAHVRDAVRAAEGRAPLGIVSGALRVQVETVLRAAGLEAFDTIVSAEDVQRGKPNPAGYLLALARLSVPASNGMAFEDTPAGVDAAKTAGLYTIGVLGTVPRERLAHADEIAASLDADLVERLLER